MLILSRRKNEALVIGETISVRIVEIRRNHVRLGVEAPRATNIRREEIASNRVPGGDGQETGQTEMEPRPALPTLTDPGSVAG